MIIGTAGHIDHGKSALVTALTGRTMDRLPEERRREITIELNFAPLDLGGGRTAGVVDVPGHEDFIRTMVAGASGIDVALLVVAADEGIMPQTEEHLLILEQLGIGRAIPVITKADLAEPDWIELVVLEVGERLARSPISFESPVVLSARTGAGIQALRDRLAAISRMLEQRPVGDAFRMPIDRVFSLPGVGTVVTGTAWSGRLVVGDPVLALPSGQRGRVRSLESHGKQVDRSRPGARTAVGLAGVDRAAFSRGEVLVTEQLPWTPSPALDVEIHLAPSATRALSARTRLRVLLGTAEVMARVLPRQPIEPGTTGRARLKLETPQVARARDRFVLRSFSPVDTIGGGVVLDPLPPRRRTPWPAGLGSADPGERLLAVLERHSAGVDATLLPILLGVPESTVSTVAARQGAIRQVGNIWVGASTVEQIGQQALTLVRHYHRQHPEESGMPLETLRHALRAREQVIEAALDDFARAGRLRRQEGRVALAGFVPRVVGGDAEVDRIVGILTDAQLAPPSVAELERSTGRRDLHPLLRLAAARGRVAAVERDRYYAREALDRFTVVLNDMGREGPISPAAVRDRLGISRKYLIPLLEWADGQGITVREGDGRRLRAKV
ncbi:MAG TPA: selenocysteine-specific translation elongation factor [Gemmatimonadales bacterium]|nr:selenocysteine-specific translation elongation factor [Gemmatimonadales bacterium]